MRRRFEIQSKTSENTKLDQQHSENHAAKLAQLRAVYRLVAPDQSKHEFPVFEQQRRKQQDELKGVTTIDYRHTDTPRLRGGTPLTGNEVIQDVMGPEQYQDSRNYRSKKHKGEKTSENENEAYNVYSKFIKRAASLSKRGKEVTRDNMLNDDLHTLYEHTTKHNIIYSFLPGNKLDKTDENSKSKYQVLNKNYNKARAWAVKEYEKHGFPGLDEEAAIAEYTKTYLQTEVIERKQDEEASSSRRS